MFCKHCGSKVADGVKFCPACGKQLGDGTAPKTQQTAQTHAGTSAQPTYTSASAGNAAPRTPKMPKAHAHASAPGVKYKKRFNIGNYALWAGCVIALASLFMTFATASVTVFGYTQSESVKLIDTEDGVFFLGIIVIVAVVNIFKLNIVSIIGSCITIFFMQMEIKNVSDGLGGFEAMVEYGAGRTLLILGSIVMLVAAVAAFILNMKAKKAAQG